MEIPFPIEFAKRKIDSVCNRGGTGLYIYSQYDSTGHCRCIRGLRVFVCAHW